MPTHTLVTADRTDESGERPRPLLVNVKQAAELLGIGRSMIYNLIDQGEIIPIHIGRCVRFRTQDLDDYVTKLR